MKSTRYSEGVQKMHNNIITIFGNKISNLIEKPPIACKGLVRFSIIDFRKKSGIIYSNALRFNEFQQIIEGILKEKLKLAQINNIDDVISELLDELTKNQAIFTMSL